MPRRTSTEDKSDNEARNTRLEAAFGEEVETLRSRLASLETERSRLIEEESSRRGELDLTKQSLQDALARISDLEAIEQELRSSKQLLSQRELDLSAAILKVENTQSSLIEVRRESSEVQAKLSEQLRIKSETIEDQDRTISTLKREFELDKSLLMGQVDELRSAGQETIALYEDRLSAADARRYELEDMVGTLQDKLNALARPLSPGTMARHASEAAQIDNENLREQAAHLQRRITSLEELLEDTRTAARAEESTLRSKLEKQRETELLARKEVEMSKGRIEECRRGEAVYRSRIEELETALRENGHHLGGCAVRDRRT